MLRKIRTKRRSLKRLQNVLTELLKNQFEMDETAKKERKQKIEKEMMPLFFKQLLPIHQKSSGKFMVSNEVSAVICLYFTQ